MLGGLYVYQTKINYYSLGYFKKSPSVSHDREGDKTFININAIQLFQVACLAVSIYIVNEFSVSLINLLLIIFNVYIGNLFTVLMSK